MKITELNLYVFDREFGSFSHVPASSRFDATSLPHLKRCVAAGYVVRDGEWLRVTPAGEALRGVDDGFPGGVDPAGLGTDRLRVLGNAVVPQVAEAVGRLTVAAIGGFNGAD